MSSIIATMMSVIMIWAAALQINYGLTAGTETASLLRESVREEYTEHLCGSIKAASSNLISAGEVLDRMFPEASASNQSEVNRLLTGLETFDSGLPWGVPDCDAAAIHLHQQNPGMTPYDFPNMVYRLNWNPGEKQ